MTAIEPLSDEQFPDGHFTVRYAADGTSQHLSFADYHGRVIAGGTESHNTQAYTAMGAEGKSPMTRKRPLAEPEEPRAKRGPGNAATATENTGVVPDDGVQ